MKRKLLIISFSALIISLFSCGKCEDGQSSKKFIVQNDSEEEIFIEYSSFYIENECFKPVTKFEYDDFIRDKCIEPFSCKNFGDVLFDGFIRSPLDTTYIYSFNRIDMDTMSCEEFKQKYPIKKIWKLTKSDVEALNWKLSYP